MREFQYLPSAVFKIQCADFKKRFPTYPKLFRQMYGDKQANKDIEDQLLDLKTKK